MIDVAIDAATKAGNLAMSYSKKKIKVSYKADKSPVTPADKHAERLIREKIAKNFPDHGIIGEEFPDINPRARYQWVIDPIDGTKDFIRNNPFWATLVAVLENRNPIIGVAHFPTSNELFAAQKNKGTFLNGKKVKVSNIKKLDQAYLSHDSLSHFARINKAKNLIEITKVAQTKRGFSTFGLNLILKGNIDIKLDPHGAIYDFAAPSILVQEAGGEFSDFKGNKSLTSGSALYTNGHLHKQVIKLLKD